MRKPLTVIIVTLSVVCTLKGMLKWSIQRIKAMILYIVYGILFVDTVNTKIKALNALNAMFVETVDTLVFVAHTQHHIKSTMRCENSTVLCIKWPFAPARREGYLLQYSIWKAFCLRGLAVHQSVQGGSFVNFLRLVKLQGWLQASCTANPQFLKLRGCSATR